MFYYNVLIYKRQVPIFKKKFELNIKKSKLFILYFNNDSELKLFNFLLLMHFFTFTYYNIFETSIFFFLLNYVNSTLYRMFHL